MQVIGDSNPFSESGHEYAVAILEDLLRNHPGFLLYGFTSNKHGGANGVVEACLKENPQFIFKVFANIVYHDSIRAIKEWRCTAYEDIKNYLLVFDKEKDCYFGDDIELSDRSAEKLLCLEGGVISFCQLVNTLAYHENPDITLVYGIRDGEPWFSAAEFLAKLKKANSIEDLYKIKEAYLQGENSKKLYDPANGKTPSEEFIAKKEKQINEAFAKLIAIENVLEKLKNVKVKVHPQNEKIEVHNQSKISNSGWVTQSLWAVELPNKAKDQVDNKTPTLGCSR